MTTTSTTPTTLVLPTPGRGASAANSKVIRPEDMPPFMVNLRRVTGVESKALQFLVLKHRHFLTTDGDCCQDWEANQDGTDRKHERQADRRGNPE